jgi:prevent-host-death family protein
MQEIQLRDAKARLSAVIDQARQGEASIITRHGHPEAVVLSFEEWRAPFTCAVLRQAADGSPAGAERPAGAPGRTAGYRDLTLVPRGHERSVSRSTGQGDCHAGPFGLDGPQQCPSLSLGHHRHLSVITVAEVEDGIAKSRRLRAHRNAERLSEWLETVLLLYDSRVLPADVDTARRVGILSDLARGQGQAPGLADLAIAATAQQNGLTILTRNLRHFGPLGVAALDPFGTLPVMGQ